MAKSYEAGSVSFGIGANISQAMRALNSLKRELGGFSRIQANLNRMSVTGAASNAAALRNQLSMLRATKETMLLRAQDLKQQIAGLKVQESNIQKVLASTKAMAKARDEINTANVNRLRTEVAYWNQLIAENKALPKGHSGKFDASNMASAENELRLARAHLMTEQARIATEKEGHTQLQNRIGLQLQGVQFAAKDLSQTKEALQQRIAGVALQQQQLRGRLAEALAADRAERQRQRELEQEQKRLAIQQSIREVILTTVAGFATGSTLSLIKESTVLAARVENLGTILENVGQLANYNEAQLGSLEERVKSLGITTATARKSLSLLALNEQDLGHAASLARIAQDAASIAAINSSDAFEKLTVAIQRLDTRMLRQLGIVVNLRQVYARYALETGKSAETLSAAEKQQLLLNEVLRRGANIAGTYEAAMGDAFKQMTTLDRLHEEFTRELGGNFLPIFEKIIGLQTDFLGRTDDDGMRGWIKNNGPLAAGVSATAIALGGFSTALLSGSIAAQAFNLSLKGVLATSWAIAKSPLGIALGAVVLLTGALTYLAASQRESRIETERHNAAVRQTTQNLVEVRESAKIVRELGQVIGRSAAQQDTFNSQVEKIISLLPKYGNQLRALKGDMQGFLALVDRLTGSINRPDEEVKKSFDNQRALLEGQLQDILKGSNLSSTGVADLTDKVPREGGKLFDRVVNEAKVLEQALVEIRRIANDTSIKTEDAADNVKAFIIGLKDGTESDVERFNLLIGQLRDINSEADQFQQALDTIHLQAYKEIFARQQEAADIVLKQTKRFEGDRLELVKDTNYEIIQDYQNLSKAVTATFLTMAQIKDQYELDVKTGTARITANMQGEIDRLTAAIKEAEKNSPEQAALEKQLKDQTDAKSAAIYQVEQNAKADAALAERQLQDRARLEAEALKFIQQRVKEQERSTKLLEIEAYLHREKAEGLLFEVQAQEKLRSLMEEKQAYEEATRKALDEIVKQLVFARANAGRTGDFADVERITKELEQLQSIMDAQAKNFDARRAVIKAEADRQRAETLREIDESVKDGSIEELKEATKLLEVETKLADLRSTSYEIQAQERLASLKQEQREMQEASAKMKEELENRLRGGEVIGRETGDYSIADAARRELEQVQQLLEAQNANFLARQNAILAEMKRQREEATREVNNFVTDSAGRLGTEFTSSGSLRELPERFKAAVKAAAEFRVEFRNVTDSYVEQIRKAQSAGQVDQLGQLFKQEVRTRQDEIKKELQELQNKSENLINEGLSDAEYFKQRDALDAEINKKRQELFDQKDIEATEQERINKELQDRLTGLQALADLTTTRLTQEQLITAELERQKQAALEFAAIQRAMTVERGGLRTGPDGQIAPGQANPPTTITNGASALVQGQAGNGQNPLILLDTFLNNQGVVEGERIRDLLDRSGKTAVEAVQLIRDVYKGVADQTIANTEAIEKVKDELRRSAEAFASATRARGLRR
jgi:hypothetical protein